MGIAETGREWSQKLEEFLNRGRSEPCGGGTTGEMPTWEEGLLKPQEGKCRDGGAVRSHGLDEGPYHAAKAEM